MRHEVKQLKNFFAAQGDIVDMNLDYFPDKIVVTYTKHSDVLKILN